MTILARTLALLFLLACSPCAAAEPDDRPAKVLFVGNSLTYYGNLPAIYSALAVASGRPAPADMIVQGGATLADRPHDGSVARALAEGGYTALVLQERGGDLIGAFGPEAREQSRVAIRTLAELGRQSGATVVLLGTYQGDPTVSQRLVEEESRAAAGAGIGYIEVSERLRRLRDELPQRTWFATDGLHPGKDLALLQALLVHQALHGNLPGAAALTVRAPIYGANTGLDGSLRAAHDPPPLPGTPLEIHYPFEAVAALLDRLAEPPLVERGRSDTGARPAKGTN